MRPKATGKVIGVQKAAIVGSLLSEHDAQMMVTAFRSTAATVRAYGVRSENGVVVLLLVVELTEVVVIVSGCCKVIETAGNNSAVATSGCNFVVVDTE